MSHLALTINSASKFLVEKKGLCPSITFCPWRALFICFSHKYSSKIHCCLLQDDIAESASVSINQSDLPSFILGNSVPISKDSEEDVSDIDSISDHDSTDFSSDSESHESSEESEQEEDYLIPGILDALDQVQLEEVIIQDEYLEGLPSIDMLTCTDKSLEFLEVSFEGIQLSGNAANTTEEWVETTETETSHITLPIPAQFGFAKHIAPPLLVRHPEPYAGRDDDPVKLKEIASDVLIKLGLYDNPDNSQRILFGPDHKIGQNVLQMVKMKKFATFLPEFPCLHLRKSCITITFSAYKHAGLMQLIQYMRNDDSTEWAKLISAKHIDVATRYVKRLATALRMSFLLKFWSELPSKEASEFMLDMENPGPHVAEAWYDRFHDFIDKGSSINGSFALHVDIMHHLESIVAVALAERLGGSGGYSLLLAHIKSNLTFNFLNGATSYAPYTLQLLCHHAKVGPFYRQLKECLYSTPLMENSKVNMATDTKRELDHQVISKSFRSGSTMDSVMRRTSLADDLTRVHKIRQDQRNPKAANKDTDVDVDNLGWQTTQVDENYILPTVLLILRRGGLSLESEPTPFNVYAKVKTALSPSILDKNGKNVGEYLIRRYISKEGLFNCTAQDIPHPNSVTGDKDLVSKATKSKGTTVKRTSGGKAVKPTKTAREVKEDKRKKDVALALQRVECLSSEMNACQALVKPDCSKPKVAKSQSMADALKTVLYKCFTGCKSKIAEMEKFLGEKDLVSYRADSKHPMSDATACTIIVVIVEFAGVKFKTKAISGLQYIQSVERNYLQHSVSLMPNIDRIVVVEEKYSFTPDNFKAATREQRRTRSDTSIHHLKTGRELLSSEKFDKAACSTSPEGKSLIGTYLAKNIDKIHFKHDIIIDIDSELIIKGCTCPCIPMLEGKCECQKYAVPLRGKFCNSGLETLSEMAEIQQRKGEAEMAAADWLMQSANGLQEGEAVASLVTSGDIDAVIIHMFVVARLWPRKDNRTFINAVYVLLQKPSGTDVYNITKIIETLEHTYPGEDMAVKVALTLCLGGNDFLPKLYDINHSKVLQLFLSETEFRNGLYKIDNGMIHVDYDVYVEFIKHLYCSKSTADPKCRAFDDVRRSSMIGKRKLPHAANGTEKTKSPKKWMPPKSALKSMCDLLNLQISYLQGAGDGAAFLPDFLAADCLQKAQTGEIEYNFGSESFLAPAELLQFLQHENPKKTTKGNKRTHVNTPQKGMRKKKLQLSSTPVKDNAANH